MDRVFLDANILFSVAYLKESGLLELWKLGQNKHDLVLITSTYALEEAKRNLSASAQRSRLNKLIKAVEVVEEGPVRTLVSEIKLNEKDRPIMAAAIRAKAIHLLTGDFKHFGPYFGQTISGVAILPPAEYLKTHSET